RTFKRKTTSKSAKRAFSRPSASTLVGRTGEAGDWSALSTKNASSRYFTGEGEPFTTSAFTSRGTVSVIERASSSASASGGSATVTAVGPPERKLWESVFFAVPPGGRSTKPR